MINQNYETKTKNNRIPNVDGLSKYNMDSLGIPINNVNTLYTRSEVRSISLFLSSTTNVATGSIDLNLDDNYPKRIKLTSLSAFDIAGTGAGTNTFRIIEIKMPNLFDKTSIFCANSPFTSNANNYNLEYENKRFIPNIQQVNINFQDSTLLFTEGPTFFLNVIFYY